MDVRSKTGLTVTDPEEEEEYVPSEFERMHGTKTNQGSRAADLKEAGDETGSAAARRQVSRKL